MSDNTSLIPEGFPGDGLDEFTTAYIECMLWSSNDESTPEGGVPLDKNYSIDDIAPEAMVKIVADCERFRKENAALLDAARIRAHCTCGFSIKPSYSAHGHAASCAAERPPKYDAEMAGHDFWLTRCGHGAGFWDRNLGEVGDKLTEAAKAFGEVWPCVGDDGKIYV